MTAGQDADDTEARTTESADIGLLAASVREAGPMGPVGYILTGWFLGLVGAAMAVNSDGDDAALVLGAIVGSVGSIFCLVGVIAQGVKVGNRASAG